MVSMEILANHGPIDPAEQSEWTVHARCITIHPQYRRNDNSRGLYKNREDMSTTGSANSVPTIETVWEVSKTREKHHLKHQQRIAIYAGPEHSHHATSKLVLTTMALPSDTSIPPPPLLHPLVSLPSSMSKYDGNDTNELSSLSLTSPCVLAWVHFRSSNDTQRDEKEHRPLHKVLCCLHKPNSLYIWDVFPEKSEDRTSSVDAISIPSEGWMITLPFDCRTIIPLNDDNDNSNSTSGLLLQRKPDVKDVLVYENSTPSTTQPAFKNHFNDYDDGFVLLGPPSTWQQKLQQPAPVPKVSSTFNQQGMKDDMNMDTNLPEDITNHPVSSIMPEYQPQSPVVSLFSLHHPLEDVIPVTIQENNKTLSMSTENSSVVDPITDVFEQVIWVGTAEWMNDNKSDVRSNDDVPITSQAQIMVTYHTIEHRHAIYVITRAPPPPAIPPLHEQTRRRKQQQQQQQQKRKGPSSSVQKNYGPMRDIVNLSIDDEDEEQNHGNDISSHLDMIIDTNIPDDDVPSDLFGRTTGVGVPPKSGYSHPLKMDHDIALADALGVTYPHGHRSRVSSSPRPQQPYLSMSGGGGSQLQPIHYRTKAPIMMMTQDQGSQSAISPLYGTSINNYNDIHGSKPMNTDVSHHTTASVATAARTVTSTPYPPSTPSLNEFFETNLMNALHPRVAMHCLYREAASPSTSTIPCATTVCLISNETAMGALILAMLRGDNTLMMYSLIPGPNQIDCSHKIINREIIREVQFLSCIPSVISIAPIYAIPTPPRNIAVNHKSTISVWKTTDLLLIRENGNNCALYRANRFICTCDFNNDEGRDETSIKMVRLSDPVMNTYTLYVGDSNEAGKYYMTRCKLSLSLNEQSSITERVLSCLDATLYGTDTSMNLQCIQLVIKLRTDCHRFLNAILSKPLSHTLPARDILLFDILHYLLVQVLRHHLSGEATMSSNSLLSNNNTSGSNWEALLCSDFHRSYSSGVQFHSSNIKIDPNIGSETSPRSITSFIQNVQSSIGSFALQDVEENENWKMLPLFSLIFDSIHLLYEDTKLSAVIDSLELSSLSKILIDLTTIAQQLGGYPSAVSETFLSFYRKDTENTMKEKMQQISTVDPSRSATDTDSSLMWTSFTAPPSIFDWTENALDNEIGIDANRCGTYANITDWRNVNPVCRRTRLVLRLFPLLSICRDNINDCTGIVQTLLEEGFTDKSMIREELCSGISLPLLEMLYQCRNTAESADVPEWNADAWMLVGRRDLAMNSSGCQAVLYSESDTSQDAPSMGDTVEESCDGLTSIEQSAAIIFPEDNRVHEAARLLCSSRPIFLRVARPVEVSDHDFERLKQKRLLTLSYRVLALPTGRGMLTIGRFRPIPTEPLQIPVLCLKGRVPPTNSTVVLDTSECPIDMHVWPEFHNGVAAGLRLPVKGDPCFVDFTIPRTWILYNRPSLSSVPAPTMQDGGEEPTSSTQTQSYSHGGFLLALGLRGHLAVLDMSDVYEYLTQGCATTTVGVLLGMAANKRGTCDLSVSKMLCLHIPSLIPQHFSAIDVASIVQTSAIVGAGLLFQGSAHRMMTEFLLNEIGKRPDADINTSDRESYTLACGLALGTVNLCLGEALGTDSKRLGLADLHIEERLIRYVIGGVDKDEVDRTRESNDRFSLPNSMVGSDNEKCSTIYESHLINTSVTAPGATMALGLMYLKTNNKEVAESLSLPNTHFLLEFVRPDFLGFRVISRALIMWDTVEASRKWVNDQVPLVVRDAYEQIEVTAKVAYGSRWPATLRNQVEEYDRRAIKQIYTHVISSACFALGLRFAGTGNTEAKEVIMGRVMEMHALREATDPVSFALRPEIPILESCLGCAAVALAMVLSGTGDLDALRVFKILRWRCDNDSQYGIHMIFGMCTGLLFLGGGTCTLGQDPADIAALVTAFFPRFPVTTTDNQYHLQALRHLYALAVKRTELKAIDVDTKEFVQVPVQIYLNELSTDVHKVRVPCLLRNSGSLHQELRVMSDKYFPCKLDLLKQNGFYSFFVQRRFADQSSFFPMHQLSQNSSSIHPFLRAYSEHFPIDMKGSERQKRGHDFLSRVIFTCQKSDCPDDILPICLKIWYGLLQLKNMDVTTRECFLWDLRLLQCYYLNWQTRPNICLLDHKILLPYIFECAGRSAESLSTSLNAEIYR